MLNRSVLINWLETGRRLALVLSLCLWFGGFTFYSLVVIHTGHRVLGSRIEVGFLTQAVTRWLNLISIPALALMFWNACFPLQQRSRFVRGTLLGTWLIIASIQVTLFLLHPKLDALLDANSRSILSRDQFKSLHLLYMNLSTAQWVATILYLSAALFAWRKLDEIEATTRATLTSDL